MYYNKNFCFDIDNYRYVDGKNVRLLDKSKAEMSQDIFRQRHVAHINVFNIPTLKQIQLIN